MDKILIIHDSGDFHGNSAAVASAIVNIERAGMGQELAVATEGFLLGEVSSGGRRLASSILRRYSPEKIIVFDIPVDASNPQGTAEFVKALAEKAEVIFVDHHKTTLQHKNLLEEAGAKVMWGSGVFMTKLLYKELTEDEMINFVDDEIEYLARNLIGLVLLAGNWTDFEPEVRCRPSLPSEVPLVGKAGNYLLQFGREQVVGVLPHLLTARQFKTIAELAKRFDEMMAPEEDIQKLLGLCRRKNGVLYCVLPKPPEEFFKGRSNYVGSEVLRATGAKALVMGWIGKDPRTPGVWRAVVLAQRSPCGPDVNFLDVLRSSLGVQIVGHPSYALAFVVSGGPEIAEDEGVRSRLEEAVEKAAEAISSYL